MGYSAARIWEVAIKYSLGREDFDFAPDDIQSLAEATGFIELPVRAAQAGAVAAMPWRHRAPFDRILIAQAQSLPAYLLTRDALPRHYSDLLQVLEKRARAPAQSLGTAEQMHRPPTATASAAAPARPTP